MTAGATAILAVIGGGAAGIAALTKDQPQMVTATGRELTTGAAPAPTADGVLPPAATGKIEAGPPVAAFGRRQAADEADRTAPRSPHPPLQATAPDTPAATVAPAAPSVVRTTVTETRAIPFGTRLVSDPAMPRGAKRVESEGVPGEETLRYLVTYVGGQEAERQLIGRSVTREPQQRVIAFGSQGRGLGGPGDHGGPGDRGDHGGPGRPGGPGRHRECGVSLSGCLPIGRSACPPEESGTVPLSGSVDVLDQDLSMIDPDTLDGLELEPGLSC